VNGRKHSMTLHRGSGPSRLTKARVRLESPILSMISIISPHRRVTRTFDPDNGAFAPITHRGLRTSRYAMSHPTFSPPSHFILPFSTHFHIRTLSFEVAGGGLDLYSLIEFLYSRTHNLRTFKLVWALSPFLDGVVLQIPEGLTISGPGTCRHGHIR